MLEEALVLNGNGGINQIGGDILIGSPDSVFLAIEILQRLILSG